VRSPPPPPALDAPTLPLLEPPEEPLLPELEELPDPVVIVAVEPELPDE
jgi:hypothetical protein